jgi:hypothetical protein
MPEEAFTLHGSVDTSLQRSAECVGVACCCSGSLRLAGRLRGGWGTCGDPYIGHGGDEPEAGEAYLQQAEVKGDARRIGFYNPMNDI